MDKSRKEHFIMIYQYRHGSEPTKYDASIPTELQPPYITVFWSDIKVSPAQFPILAIDTLRSYTGTKYSIIIVIENNIRRAHIFTYRQRDQALMEELELDDVDKLNELLNNKFTRLLTMYVIHFQKGKMTNVDIQSCESVAKNYNIPAVFNVEDIKPFDISGIYDAIESKK